MSYRILSLDGGGTWALIQAKALLDLYGDISGHDLLQKFDMAAANSGGSIVLGGLICNLRPSEILRLFSDKKRRQQIFSPTQKVTNRIVRKLLGIGPKYSAAKKLVALRNNFGAIGDKTLPEAAALVPNNGRSDPIRVLITSFDYDRLRATFFRSAPTSSPGLGKGDVSAATLAEAVHAASNAPVNYFDGPAEIENGRGRYWDGAITGCNNPVMVAVTEAQCAGIDPFDIIALSIGTGTVARPWPTGPADVPPIFQPKSQTGLLKDARKLAGAILDDPPDMATFLAHVMTGMERGVSLPADSRIVRMNPLISPEKNAVGQWIAPPPMKLEDFDYMVNLDMDAVEDDQVIAIESYAELWLDDKALNQPIRMNRDTLKREIGQERYSNAKEAWLALSNAANVVTAH